MGLRTVASVIAVVAVAGCAATTNTSQPNTSKPQPVIAAPTTTAMTDAQRENTLIEELKRSDEPQLADLERGSLVEMAHLWCSSNRTFDDFAAIGENVGMTRPQTHAFLAAATSAYCPGRAAAIGTT